MSPQNEVDFGWDGDTEILFSVLEDEEEDDDMDWEEEDPLEYDEAEEVEIWETKCTSTTGEIKNLIVTSAELKNRAC